MRGITLQDPHRFQTMIRIVAVLAVRVVKYIILNPFFFFNLYICILYT